MTHSQALEIAKTVAAGRCTVTLHKGAHTSDRAIRLSGLDQRDAREIGMDIASAILGEYRQASGFCAVWYNPSIPVDKLPNAS